MVKSLITLVLSTLRWTHWLVQYAVVYPLGMMMLLVVVVFWAGHNTPGQMLVKTIESVQREGYVIHDCTGPASREALNGDAVKPLLPPDLQEDCTTVSTDAAGYAAPYRPGLQEKYSLSLAADGDGVYGGLDSLSGVLPGPSDMDTGLHHRFRIKQFSLSQTSASLNGYMTR